MGERIKHAREQRSYDQAELAREAGISPSTLWRIETGRTKARGVTLRKIAAALGVAPGALSGNE